MIKKRFITFLTALLVFTAISGFSVFAYDVDFSIKPQGSSAKQGDSINVNIVITTHDKGYTAFEMQLLYDESVFSCESQYNDNGYVGSGKNGVYTLIYEDPSIDEPAPTKKGDAITIPVKFAVLSDAALGDTKLNASVISCTGVNTLDLNSPVKLELAQLLSKTVKINEGEPGTASTPSDTTSSEDTSSDDFGGTIDQPSLPYGNDDDSANWVQIVGIIIGGIVVFFSGCVVGYLFKQKQSDSARDDYYSSRRHNYSDSDDIDIGDSRSGFSGISGIRNSSESTNGGRSYGRQSQSVQVGNQQYQTSANPGKENTFSGYNGTVNSYSNGYKQQAPMQTSYASGALQTSASAPYNNNINGSGNVGQQSANSFSAVAPKTYPAAGNQQAANNNQWQVNTNFAVSQPAPNPYVTPAQAQPASTFAVQNQQPAAAVAFNTAPKAPNSIEMAYRGEGTSGTYRPTPPVQGTYAPAYTQFAQGQQQVNGSVSQPMTAANYQPTAQKVQPQQFKTEYTIGRSGYGLPVNQPQQNMNQAPRNGSYLPQQQANQAMPQQSAQPQATVQNRFLTGNPQQGNNGYNNNNYQR